MSPRKSYLPLFVIGLYIAGASGLSIAADTLPFRVRVLNSDSEFSAAAIIDIDKDGVLDITCGAWWYSGPEFTKHPLREVELIGNRYDDYSSLPLDVDRDGHADLVSVNYRSKSLYWVRNAGSGDTPWIKQEIDRPGASESGRLADLDNDGQLDIVPNGTTFAAWYRNNTRAAVEASTNGRTDAAYFVKVDLPQELAGHGIGIGDINRDGRLDLIGPNGWAESPEHPERDRWHWHPDFKLFKDASVPILVMDVDGDGDQDLVWGRAHNVGLYWTEQTGHKQSEPVTEVVESVHAALKDQQAWVTRAIDTSLSCIHAPLVADLDGDGREEVVALKRYQGHDGRDPGENEPLFGASYQFDRSTKTWLRKTLSNAENCGADLDPKAGDIDGDGDIDLVCPSRVGLTLLENLRIDKSTNTEQNQTRLIAAEPAPLGNYAEHQDLSYVLRPDAKGEMQRVKIETGTDLGLRQRDVRRHMERVMGELPNPYARVPLDVRIQESVETEKYTRVKIDYSVEPGSRVPAYLLIPHGLKQAAPAMLCLHPTNFQTGKAQLLGLGGNTSRFYAHELAELGFICLAPDYPGFAEYKYDFKTEGSHYVAGTMKAIWDNVRAIDLLESLPITAHDKIGCIGHSLGGHNTLFTSCFDRRIRCAVTSCGFNAFEDYYGGKLKGWTSDRYMPRIESLFHSDPKQMPFDFPEVLAVMAPRPLLVNAPLRDANFEVVGVRKCEASVRPVYEKFGKSSDLVFRYPDAEHDFPDEVRSEAYQWLSDHLR